jgi:hypothetical protein
MLALSLIKTTTHMTRRYLYPAEYFEPFTPNQNGGHHRPTKIYLDDFTKGVLHAEALAAHKSVSALLREWIDERLDLPAGA